MLLQKELFHKFLKYSMVGFISIIIYFLSVFMLVEKLFYSPLFGTAIAFIIMTIVSFFLNIRFTFGSQFSHQKLLRFLTVSAVGFVLNFLLIYLVVHILVLHYVVGEIVTTLIIPIVNFLLNNYWTFQTQVE